MDVGLQDVVDVEDEDDGVLFSEMTRPRGRARALAILGRRMSGGRAQHILEQFTREDRI